MSGDKIVRIRELAGKTWARTLDGRLGVAQAERMRMECEEPSPLPVSEPLIADKSRHVIERPDSQKVPPDNSWVSRWAFPNCSTIGVKSTT